MIGSNVPIKCSASGTPQPTITWRVNGEPLQGQSYNSLTLDSLLYLKPFVLSASPDDWAFKWTKRLNVNVVLLSFFNTTCYIICNMGRGCLNVGGRDSPGLLVQGYDSSPARGPGFRFWKSFVIVNSPLELKERLKVDFDVKLWREKYCLHVLLKGNFKVCLQVHLWKKLWKVFCVQINVLELWHLSQRCFKTDQICGCRLRKKWHYQTSAGCSSSPLEATLAATSKTHLNIWPKYLCLSSIVGIVSIILSQRRRMHEIEKTIYLVLLHQFWFFLNMFIINLTML